MFLFLIPVFLSLTINLNSCSGGGGGGGSSSTALTPSDLGWTIPTTDPENVTTLTTGEEISSELISITVKDNVNREAVVEIANGVGGTIDGELPDLKAYYIKFPTTKTGNEINTIVDQLRLNTNIETASAVYMHESTESLPATTDIERANLLTDDQKWGFKKIKMPEAWQAIRNSGKDLANITVAVIDTGVGLSHPDLEGNLILQSNGYTATDFGDGDDNVSYDSFDMWANCIGRYHGTQVSGIIASSVNGEGINGVAPTAKIFPLKVSKHREGCTDTMKVKIPDYAVTYAVVWAKLAKVAVINLSLGTEFIGGINDYKQDVEYKAISLALKNNIVVVAGAGNSGKNSSTFFPAAVDGVISVGATDKDVDDGRWTDSSNSSNYSDDPTALWVAAPGERIYTTNVIPDYKSVSGTSFATPFVSGLAALLKQLNPSLTNTEIANIIRSTADNISVTYPDSSTHTWKRINSENAVNKVLSPPNSNAWTATSTTNAPSATANEYHTAVWTGSEMIVWGGYDGSNYVNTGGRYNPTTDSWTATTTTSAPSVRAAHTAVWTGSQMIVWGGEIASGGTTYNTGGKYNPSTNSWTTTSTTTGAPGARFVHTAVWTGSEMIVWGGKSDSSPSSSLSSGARYNPSTDTWASMNSATGALPLPRYVHTAVWNGSEMIIWGGTSDGASGLNSGSKYNPSTNIWTVMSTTNAPSARANHTAVWTDSEMIVWGGTSNGTTFLNTGGRYTP